MNRPKIKGTAAETAVVNYVKPRFKRAHRRTLEGRNDRGDIGGIDGVVIEVKNVARMALAEWLDEATVEAQNDGGVMGVVWHKRRGKGSPGDWYVTMSGETFVDLLVAVEYARTLTEAAV